VGVYPELKEPAFIKESYDIDVNELLLTLLKKYKLTN